METTTKSATTPGEPSVELNRQTLGGAEDWWRQGLARWQALSIGARTVVGALLASVLLAVVFGASLGLKGKEYRVLFSNVSGADGAAIVAALQQMSVPYQFTEGGGAIMVPENVVYETRLKLAGQGLPKSGNVGFELLENQKFGTSQFVERVNYLRGLEGELSRSIASIGQVKSARVHLAVPKQTAFVREQERPSASVLITLYPGRVLDPAQSAAIARLVSSSVPGMSPQDVSILDSEGRAAEGRGHGCPAARARQRNGNFAGQPPGGLAGAVGGQKRFQSPSDRGHEF